jgi:hypothetical protein
MIRISFSLFLLSIFALALNANERGSSEPFISGDSFRANADFTWDELSKDIDPELVQHGSIIFLKTDFMEEFFTTVHPHIPYPYILVTHNSDFHVPGKYGAYLDDPKIMAWFGQNVENCDHPHLHRIPIGIANQMWRHGNVETFKHMQLQTSGSERNILLYMNFSPGTFLEERSKVVEMFKDKPYCVASEPQKDLSAYLADLADSKFVLSPRGNGLDCHRTWEALLMGAIPIVRTSSLDPMYEDLPVVIVKDWSEIDESFLNRKYEEMNARHLDLDKMYFAYWLEGIRSFKNPQRQKEL